MKTRRQNDIRIDIRLPNQGNANHAKKVAIAPEISRTPIDSAIKLQNTSLCASEKSLYRGTLGPKTRLSHRQVKIIYPCESKNYNGD